jgi:hypothetical protein
LRSVFYRVEAKSTTADGQVCGSTASLIARLNEAESDVLAYMSFPPVHRPNWRASFHDRNKE